MLNIFTQQGKQIDEERQTGSETPLPKANFRQYHDPAGDFDSKEFIYSLWYTKHKVLLYRLLKFGLIVIAVVLWGYSLVRWGSYFLIGRAQDKALEVDLTRRENYTAINERLAPLPLQVATTALLPGGTNKFDAVAEVLNPNEHFLVKFKYYFILDGEKTASQEALLLPQESRPLSALGLDVAGDPQIAMENLSWSRIDAHDVPNPVVWQEERLQFIFADESFVDPVPGTKATRIIFNLKNDSPYSYADPQFLAGLYNDGGLVGVIPFRTGRFNSLETKALELRSFVPNLGANSLQIFPLINVYDGEVYVP